MDKENKKRKIVSLSIMLFIVMLLVSGGSFAYWTWVTASSERTNVSLTIEAPNMSATLTGHTQNITNLIPISSCTDETYAIKKELTLTYDNLSTNAGMITGTLSVTNFVSPYGTPDSDDLSHLHYAVTTSPDSCTTKPVRGMSGIFKATSGNLFTDVTLKGSVPVNTEGDSQKYYLWVWLDSEYTHQNVGSGVTNDPMQNISFTLTWSGALANDKTEPEQPVLDPGMIPVKIANNGTVTTVLEHDTSWYNYDNKQWANVVLVDSDSRSTYQGTTGKAVNQSDILAYYVWIPRYSYKIPESTMTCGDLINSNVEDYFECYKFVVSDDDKTSFINWLYEGYGSYVEQAFGVDYTLERAAQEVETLLSFGEVYMEEEGKTYYIDELISYYNYENDVDISYELTLIPTNKINLARTIDVSFESKNDAVLMGDAVNTYRTHPAFTFGTENISGIWVGKFETTGDDTIPTVLPNLTSLTNQTTTLPFQISLKFAGGTLSNGIVSFAGSNTYGLTTNTDSHLIKNSEWGAVAYLSHSEYGINSEIRVNNSYVTGCGALEPGAGVSNECQITYGESNSYPQSTTGNISGIFDISGGIESEIVMGVISDDNGNPKSGYSSTSNSGFNGLTASGNFTGGIDFPQSKYYDLYSYDYSSVGTPTQIKCNGEICYGHALDETLGWYDEFDNVVNINSYAWFARSGIVNMTGAFFVSHNLGGSSENVWRSVLIVE